ncbi:hypothetical protein WA026_016360 [Henosepilachna vigintioctopunctata]|uniref:DUF1963 domain-containing protein n=1 Tax=Henosepilachna vigintioctopunctata TaxID=420089 RepID=A0AAW1UNS6_9CUCU
MYPDSPEIPRALEKYAQEIKATERESIAFKVKTATDLKLWHSKVGGMPYLPVGEKYPCDSKGYPLTFLMQINFSEIPPLLDYPTEGILQFYINETDDLMGLDFDNPTNQEGFRVLYFQTIENDESKLQSGVPNSESNSEDYTGCGPLDKNCILGMEFYREKQYITPFDYRFDKSISFAHDYDIVDVYQEALGTSGHRIGGYPHFTQTDPRVNHEEFQEYELLVQLDSDGNGILWGDMGIGAFFIHPNDLKDCNFSKVLYNWDCC